MSLKEKLFFSTTAVRVFGKKAFAWKSVASADERKKTLLSWKFLQAKCEIDKHDATTFTIHVKVREGDTWVWKYRKYVLMDKSRIDASTYDRAYPYVDIVDNTVASFARSGKYAFGA